jgi:hypothetical protein
MTDDAARHISREGSTRSRPPVTDDIALELIETRTFGSRVIYERYLEAV